MSCKAIHPTKKAHAQHVRPHATFQRHFRAEIPELSLIPTEREPHTLWIGCLDFRVPPELIADAKPGDMLVHYNVGNMVPSPDNAGDSTVAALIYALDHLSSVHRVVVCGHSACAAMAAMADLRYDALEPGLTWWLAQAEPVLDRVIAVADESNLVKWLIEANLVFQVKQLCRYRIVADRLCSGSLSLHGLVYDHMRGDLRELVRVETPSNLTYSNGFPRQLVL